MPTSKKNKSSRVSSGAKSPKGKKSPPNQGDISKVIAKKDGERKSKIIFSPNYDPNKVIIDRSFGVKDLVNYKKKIDANIQIFKEAIAKELTEKKRVQGMINALKADIKEARYYKKLKRTLN